jgi:hypothetical protein
VKALLDLILKNKWLKLLAVFLAVLTWIYVIQQSYKPLDFEEVPVRFVGLKTTIDGVTREYFILSRTWSKLEVTISGPANAMAQLRESKLVAEVNVAQRLKGGFPDTTDAPRPVTIDIEPEDILNLPPNTKVSEIKPKAITITLDEIDERQIKVEIDPKSDLRGEVQRGLRMVKPYAEPLRVMVRGPRSVLADLHEIHPMPVPIGNVTEALTLLPERLLDRRAMINNRLVDCLRPAPPKVTVWIEVLPRWETAKIKDIPINIRGWPNMAYNVLDVTKTRPFLMLPEVEIRGPGPKAELEKTKLIAYLDLADITDPKAKPETRMAVKFDHAPEIEIISKPTEVVVQIKAATPE